MLLLFLVEEYFFFFFQAEDGIRDKLVTGVQTCALPISNRDAHVPSEPGQEQRALDLRARDRRRVGKRAEPAAADRERQRVAALLLDSRSHGAQRLVTRRMGRRRSQASSVPVAAKWCPPRRPSTSPA